MLVVPTDVSDPTAIASLFDTVKATYGRIDLLFNNAGISTRNIPIEDLTLEQWSNVVAVNLTGSFLCAQHAFRMMKSQQPRGGRIANNGSVSAHVPRWNSTPYAATKHALTAIVLNLKQPEALSVLHPLIAVSDVLVQNFRPGVADRLGFGEPTARAINPGLIYVSISGVGETDLMSASASMIR